MRLAHSILKRKFPSVDKPLQKEARQKEPLKNVSAGAYVRNFTVYKLGNGLGLGGVAYHMKFPPRKLIG